MSYLVLARKWRPMIFDDVVGQEHITETLKKAIEKNRVAHAYIFTGTRGVGKTTTARIMARALNCEKGPTANPCGVCESCKSITGGTSFDVLEIDGASNNSVQDIRELRENVGYSTMTGKYRIFVIDEVHMLTKPAFNALLKTLEEPPKNVVFIFATTEPHKIPETIQSRCQRYDYRRISTEQILGRLEFILKAEKITYERGALLLVARKADGSMRDGLSLLDQVLSFCQESIDEKEVRSVLGLVNTETYQTIVDAVIGRSAGPVLEVIEDILYRGFDLSEFLQGLEEYLRDLLFASIPGILDNKRLSMHIDSPELVAQLRSRAAHLTDATLLRMVEVVKRAEQELKWSAFPRFMVETMLLKLVYMDSTVSIEEVLAAVKSGGAGASVAPSVGASRPAAAPSLTSFAIARDDSQKKKPELAPPPVVPAPPPPTHPETPPVSVLRVEEPPVEPLPAKPVAAVVTEPQVLSSAATGDDTGSFQIEQVRSASPDLRSVWPGFVDSLMQDRPNIGSFLSFAAVIDTTAGSIDIRYGSAFRFQFSQVTRKETREEIASRLHGFAGRRVELRITMEAEKPVETQEASGKPHAASLNDEIAREPVIETVLEMFDGEVVG